MRFIVRDIALIVAAVTSVSPVLSAGTQNKILSPDAAARAYETGVGKDAVLDRWSWRLGEDRKPPPIVPTLRTELKGLFDNNGCSFPDSVRESLRKLGDKYPLPESLVKNLGEEVLSSAPNKMPSAAVTAVMHRVSVPALKPTQENPVEDLELSASMSYTNFDVGNYIKGGFGNYVYTLDCAGVLASALSAGATFPAVDLASSAEGSLKDSTSIFFAHAPVYSPVALAINPGVVAYSVALDRRHQVDIFYAIVATIRAWNQKASDDLVISTPSEWDLIWATNRTKTALQGNSSFSIGAGAGVGVATLKASLSGNGSYDRKIEFVNYDTYIIKSGVSASNLVARTTLGKVKSDLVAKVNGAVISGQAIENVSGQEIIKFNVPILSKNICGLNWVVDEVIPARGPVPVPISTAWDPDAGVCTFRHAPGTSYQSGDVVKFSAPAEFPGDKPEKFLISTSVRK